MDHATDQPPAPGGNGFPPARAPWSVAQGLVMFVLFVLIPIAVAGLGHLVFGAFGGSDAFGMQISQHGFQMAGGAVVLIVIYVFLRVKAGGSREASDLIGLSVADPRRFVVASLVPLGVGVVALVAWALAQWAVLDWLEREPPAQEVVVWFSRLVVSGERGPALVLVFFAVVVAPFVEELTFRGLLYLPLRARLGPLPGALIASALFALIHGHLAGAGHLFILALVFTWLMEATKSMVAPILAHAAHNALMIALIVHTSGGP